MDLESPANKAPVSTSKKVQNRRFKKLQQLRQQDYFGQESIKLRHPVLYELYVGMYRKEHPEGLPSQRPFSQLLEAQLMHMEYEKLLQEERTKLGMKDVKHTHTSHQRIGEEDLEMSEQNLIDLAQLHFMRGLDKSMDYKHIDADEQLAWQGRSLDDHELINQQQEEHYFGKDVGLDPSTDTGVQDY